MDRCTGCEWRIPLKLGGQGIVCFQKNGKCPRWAVDWALKYGKYRGKPLKAFNTDEQLLEVLRL